ncbi:MAG: LCP family protein [Chloroflexota bacterium]|nr:LCP family protein [Chloroflexota bacterium]
MQRRIDDFELPPPPKPDASGFSVRHALLTFAFTTFVLGGFCFGWLFLANWRIMLTLQTTQVSLGRGPAVPVIVPDGVSVVPRGPQQPKPRGAPDGNPEQAAAVAAEEQPDLPEWTSRQRHNILLLGIDHREDEPIDGSRSDTIIVASYDPQSSSVVLVSFPRDLWVSIPGHYPQRLNVAHSAGGPELVKRTLQANFGITIHNYARVDFRGFEKVVDELGGVIVDVERPIKDDEYPTEDYGVMRLFIPPGPQLMDGKMALMYARSRHSDNDFGRARRQQRVILAIRDRALALNMVPKLPALAGAATEAVSTDMGVMDMIRLGSSGSKIERDQIKSVVVDATCATPFTGPLGEDLLQPDRQCIQAAIQRAFAEAAGQSGKVEVLNGSPRDGVARRVADQLAGAGYDVTKVDVAARRDHAETTILVLGNNRRAAGAIAQRLGVPPSAIQDAAEQEAMADVRVIVGGDRR